MAQVSSRRAPADEVVALVDTYWDRYSGWNVAHFHSWFVGTTGARAATAG
jgi:hypothetical protein